MGIDETAVRRGGLTRKAQNWKTHENSSGSIVFKKWSNLRVTAFCERAKINYISSSKAAGQIEPSKLPLDAFRFAQ